MSLDGKKELSKKYKKKSDTCDKILVLLKNLHYIIHIHKDTYSLVIFIFIKYVSFWVIKNVLGTLFQTLEIIFEMQQKMSNEKLTRR